MCALNYDFIVTKSEENVHSQIGLAPRKNKKSLI